MRVRTSNVLLSIVMTWAWLSHHVIRNRIKSFSSSTDPILRRLFSDKLIIRVVGTWTWAWIRSSMVTMEWIYFWKWWSLTSHIYRRIIMARAWILIIVVKDLFLPNRIMKSIDSKLLRGRILSWSRIDVSLIVIRFWCNGEMLRVRASNVLLSIVMTWAWLGFHIVRNSI